VFSDTACPHAYLAEAKFHRACSMLKAAHARFEPKWYGMAFRPYLANPELEGKEPVAKVGFLEKKVGKPLAEMRNVQQLRDAGQEYGLTYRYGPEDLVSGTTDSHRLMRYIGTDSGMEGVFAYRRHLMRAFN
ncbi:unnamed protein product, partial [Polarella glacialis]